MTQPRQIETGELVLPFIIPIREKIDNGMGPPDDKNILESTVDLVS